MILLVVTREAKGSSGWQPQQPTNGRQATCPIVNGIFFCEITKRLFGIFILRRHRTVFCRRYSSCVVFSIAHLLHVYMCIHSYKCTYICTCTYTLTYIWVRSGNCGCLVTWFCYQLIAKPGIKTATVPWLDPYTYSVAAWQGRVKKSRWS